MTVNMLADATTKPPVAQGPPPREPGSPDDDPRPEQPHPLDEPGESDEPPQPTDPGTDQQVGA